MNVNILGRENLIEYMKTAALREEFSHAYIFEGEKGMGKLFAAKEFAKLILARKQKRKSRLYVDRWIMEIVRT